ncbi:MAG: MG2 domain-containing protein [Pyrinomonadaceae bacterium]
MKFRLLVLFLLLFVCAFSVAAQTVIEPESSVLINEKTIDVSLVIEASKRSPGTQVDLRILDPNGVVRASASQQLALAAGKKKYKVSFPAGEIMSKASDEIAWWRVDYRVGDAHGIASLSELLRDDFDLRASAFQRVIPGEAMRVRVRSLNPFTEQAVKGVTINAELVLSLDTESDDDELKLKGTARTDGDGFAMIDFKIPSDLRLDDDPKIKITGQKNGVIRKIEEDLDDEDMDGSVILTTDKPLYQPGQAFNVRGLLLDPNNTVVPNYELEFKIEDEDDTVVYRQTLKTSAFGIAAITWQIPDNAKLGNYRVVVEADDDLDEDQLQFKVSRYDLPNFSVSTKADKTYYLPSDTTANITISADYLFGKPVTNGKVRVVQETERRWNYREQKYDVTEGAVIEGSADSTGKFIATLDLKKDLAELKASEWRRFNDISLAAYYTDLSTNQTEQRRFDIRLTKEPIHIYFIRHANQHPDLPLTAYVSTFYADGTPALCNVEIKDSKEVVTRFKTNSLGAGKFEIDIPNENVKGSSYEIRVTARDKKGQLGTFDESFDLDRDDALQIRTDKAVYKPGEIMEIDLLATQQAGYVYVDIVKGWVPVESKVVELHDGKAHVMIPYRTSFKGDLMIAAYTDKETHRWSDDKMRALRGVIFPKQQNLVINASFSKKEYRPSEDATVKFSLLDGSRKPVEGAIGLGIFDKAIEERARTESEFGSNSYSRFYRLMGYDRSFGSISLKDLNDLDLSRPIAPEIQLAAEIMLAGGWYYPSVYHSGNHDTDATELYRAITTAQAKPLLNAMKTQFKKDGDHPIDKASLFRVLAKNGIDFSQLRDPWGNPYSANFSVNRTQDVIALKSSGPDEKPGTVDDFEILTSEFSYFARTGASIDTVVFSYHDRTGGYVRDLQTLTSELSRTGIDGSYTKDHWNRDYRITFEVSGRNYLIRICSNGPNGIYEPDKYNSDDFEVWRTWIDYFSKPESEINRVLSDEFNLKKKPFPRSEAEFTEVLRRGGIDISSIKDGWGRPVYVRAAIETRYSDKTKTQNGKTTITPVTEELMSFGLRSNGPDPGKASDAVDLAYFSAAITAAHKGNGFSKAEVTTTVFSGAKGAITGTITDPNGAVIPGAEITATDESDESRTLSTRSDDEGKFLLGNLPSGRYRIRISSAGFANYVQASLQVRSQSLIEVNVSLSPAGVSQTVDVVASAEIDQSTNTTSANITTKTVTKFKVDFPYNEQTSTPRLREYFPESLVWQPELLTDKKGKAEFNFKMADNITTWKMFAIASNKKGKVGIVEKEITAFQSFFVDLDPPKFLTEGDEIHLPTQVRNYTEQKQRVDVTMDKADWFTFLGDIGKQRVDVATGGSQNAVFGFKAVTPITAGKQRVTAIGQSDSDAIEKPITVRPNGEEIVQTDSKVFASSEKFQIDYPANALANTQKAELNIYPNLFSHVAESVEGMLHRPYGCGEQTISSTYPNLMILKFVKTDSALRKKAEKYLQKGYERLTGYQIADGGFTYWGGKDTSDIALTAYALRFLNDAKEFIEVDEDVIRRAENWLIAQQRADGSWTRLYRWETVEDRSRSKLITTYVARSLAMSNLVPAGAASKPAGIRDQALAKGLTYLRTRNAEIDEPYALALLGLASLDSGDPETAKEIASHLEKMAIAEGSSVYWKLETNTPFYGWGTAGRIETTALVVQLLTRVAKLDSKPTGDIASKGLMFLLKNKDRYGVWYSTQTTINVLDAFLAILSTDSPAKPQMIQVAINGVNIPDIDVPAERLDPINVDLTGKLSASSNAIEVRSSSSSPVMAQVVATHYIDWRASQTSNVSANASRALRLDYKCDKPAAAIMEEVSCSVEAERIGFKGYGMLLAEIGTPPGADVSRESLETAVKNDWSLSRYDILPDRIVLYMWSKAGGTKFNFKFKPRYGINAQTPASIVYDYYNPEAYATVVPLRFNVR